MITFQPFRTNRHKSDMRELPIIDAIRISGISAAENERSITELLKSCLDSGDDTLTWTVQERYYALLHYLLHTTDGLLDSGTSFAEYLQLDKPHKEADSKIIGEVSGDTWRIRHLTGLMAESIERVRPEYKAVDGRLYWQAGMMAAQLYNQNDNAEMPSELEIDKWLHDRIKILMHYPESDWYQMLDILETGQESLSHYIKLTTDDTGIIALGADSALNPARFRPIAGISTLTQAIYARVN